MSKFQIDFFELAFLAEACIPPRPIARTMFWVNLTNVYWEQMSDPERAHLFDWISRNPYYEESLATQDDTKVFHARFNPDNQYLVKYDYEGEKNENRAFKMGDRYYISTAIWISKECITEVIKLNPKTEY